MSRANRPCEGPLPDALAFFLTWPTYGTWLPGDERGWVEYQHGWQLPDEARKQAAAAVMTEHACILDAQQRKLVERTIAEHCRIRGWELLAVNCRTNHVHVVVTANCHPDEVRRQLKAWCTRRLKALDQERGILNVRENWWAQRGSRRYLNDEDSLAAATSYVLDGQDSH